MTLDSILTDLNKVLVVVGPHWPFITYTLLFAFIGEVMKRQVLTPVNVLRMEAQADKLWNLGGAYKILALMVLSWTRIPLALHPLAAGFILGLIPGVPVSAGVAYGAQSVLYCMGAGMASTSLYSALRGVFTFWWLYVARKTDPVPTLRFPGDPDSVPPEAP